MFVIVYDILCDDDNHTCPKFEIEQRDEKAIGMLSLCQIGTINATISGASFNHSNRKNCKLMCTVQPSYSNDEINRLDPLNRFIYI